MTTATTAQSIVFFLIASKEAKRTLAAKTLYRRKTVAGFTLIELLVVMAIMIILTGLALSAFTEGNSLTTATDITSELVELTRGTAIAHGTYTRLYFVTRAAGTLATENYTAASIWRFQPEDTAGNSFVASSPGAWVQETQWEQLPRGIILDSGYAPNFASSTTPIAGGALDRVNYNVIDPSYSPDTYSPLGDISGSESPTLRGCSLSSGQASYLEFDGTGAVSNITAGNLGIRVVEGFIDAAGGQHLKHVDSNNNPLNYAIVAIDNLTGRVRVLRP